MAPGSACLLKLRLCFGGRLLFFFRISSGRQTKDLESDRMQARSVASPKIGDSGCQPGANCEELRIPTIPIPAISWLLVIIQKLQAEKSGCDTPAESIDRRRPIAEQGICFRYEKQDRGIS